jgi:hypothetical protein
MATLFFSDITNLSISDADCKAKTRSVRQARCVWGEYSELPSKVGDKCATARLARGGALVAIVATEVLGREDLVPGMATRLELFRAAKSGTPPVGIGNGELDHMVVRRIGYVIERQHDA